MRAEEGKSVCAWTVENGRREKRGQGGLSTGWGFDPVQTPGRVGHGSRRDGAGEQGGRRSGLRGSRDEGMSRSTCSRESKVIHAQGDLGAAPGDGAEKAGRDLSVGGHLSPAV